MFQQQKGYKTKILIQFCIFITSNAFRVMCQFSIKSGQSCSGVPQNCMYCIWVLFVPIPAKSHLLGTTVMGMVFNGGQTRVHPELEELQFVVNNIFL